MNQHGTDNNYMDDSGTFRIIKIHLTLISEYGKSR